MGIDDEREALRLPGFEGAVVTAVTQALERWRTEALEGARKLKTSCAIFCAACFVPELLCVSHVTLDVAKDKVDLDHVYAQAVLWSQEYCCSCDVPGSSALADSGSGR